MANFEGFQIYLKEHFLRVKKPCAPDGRKIKVIEPRLNRENRKKPPKNDKIELHVVKLSIRNDPQKRNYLSVKI